MRLTDFDYDLPSDLIATHPTKDRRASRLLSINAINGVIEDRMFSDFTSLLRPNDLLVFNDTRVIRARLRGQKQTGGKVDILIERLDSELTALAHIRASKAPKPGCCIDLQEGVTATVTGREDDLYWLEFSDAVSSYLDQHGEVPLPPYLGRDSESADGERYQTIYAKHDGAVAAPTAGLHFDDEMMDSIENNKVQKGFVTLHVGAGTFQSLRHDELEDNRLHLERVAVGESLCGHVIKTREKGGRVIAIGTTSVRALESAAADGAIKPLASETGLFITPGYRFRVVDAMLTNFHLPQSSLLMLVCAFAGRSRMLDAYEHAIREKYRFFSYGDAMFIVPGEMQAE